MQVLDSIVAKLDRHESDKAASEHTFLRYDKRLDNHESRIATLEDKVDA